VTTEKTHQPRGQNILLSKYGRTMSLKGTAVIRGACIKATLKDPSRVILYKSHQITIQNIDQYQ